MQNLLEDLKKLLAKDERFTAEGELLKNKIVESALKLDEDLIKLLLSHKKLKEHFFTKVGEALIFDKDKFVKFVSNKQFLPDSYTAFKNKIGLTEGNEYISEKKDVVLSWPYKDCVLEGGQTKEDSKRDEVFWNQTLAPDEIDRLLDPKVFTNAKRVDKDSEHNFDKFNRCEDGTISDNLIVKGNNLLALHSLKKEFAGKVKLIYIDPPYNTGNDSFGYNDKFNHSTWLTFMKNRIGVARELLSKDGSIWMNIDDDEGHYLKVLADSVFGRENFVANVVWQKKYSPQNDAKYFSDMHDHILIFAKDKSQWDRNLIPRTDEMNERYSNPDNDPRGPWKSSDLSVKTYSADYDYPIETPSGRIVNPPKGSCWRTSKGKFEELVEDNRIWFGVNDDAVPSIKRFLSEVQQGTPPQTIWHYEEVGHNQDARKEIVELFEDEETDFGTPKPEKLLNRIIHIGSNEGDIVLDFFAGSGTTGAVTHKMGRQYILCEQLGKHADVIEQRMQKVIKGEQGGISEEVDWQGGGDYVYLALAKWNKDFAEKMNDAKNKKELEKIWKEMQKRAFLSWRLDFGKLEKRAKEFENLSLENQKKFLLEVLDQNQLYVNYSEIEDEMYRVSEEDKKLNKEFYENS